MARASVREAKNLHCVSCLQKLFEAEEKQQMGRIKSIKKIRDRMSASLSVIKRKRDEGKGRIYLCGAVGPNMKAGIQEKKNDPKHQFVIPADVEKDDEDHAVPAIVGMKNLGQNTDGGDAD